MSVVLVTGCSDGGIGAGLCLEFLKRGCVVYATARSVDKMKSLASKGAKTIELDILDAESIKKAVDEVIKESGRIDYLVNNAGYGLFGPLSEMKIEDIDKVMKTNVLGQVSVCQAVIPHMLKQKKGKIVNIGSISGILSTPFAGAYCASKAALHALSDSLRMELKPFGIDVMVICPGAIQSNFSANSKVGEKLELVKDSIYASIQKFEDDRRNTSQNKPTETSVFCKQTVNAILRTKKAYFFCGKLSWMGPFLKRWLPLWISDMILSRRSGLHLLKNN